MKSRVLFSVPSVALVLMSNLVVQPAVQATPLKPDWINGAPIVQKSGQEYSTEGCVDEVRQVALNRTMYYLPEDENPKTWCIYRYNGFDITFYKRKASSVLLDNVDQFNLMSREESGVAISFDGGELVPVQDVSYQTKDRLVYSANSDKVLFNSSCEWTGCTVDLVDYIWFTSRCNQANNTAVICDMSYRVVSTIPGRYSVVIAHVYQPPFECLQIHPS